MSLRRLAQCCASRMLLAETPCFSGGYSWMAEQQALLLQGGRCTLRSYSATPKPVAQSTAAVRYRRWNGHRVLRNHSDSMAPHRTMRAFIRDVVQQLFMSYPSMFLTLGTVLGLYQWMKYEQQRRVKEQAAKQDVSVGEAQVGGPFMLRDTSGKVFSSDQLKGEFSILYFGFTFCPDICPDELEKMVKALDMVEKRKGTKVQPVFITIDPERDTAQLMKKYLAEFSDRIIGLWGSMEEIKKVAKLYRVYFMKTNDTKDNYLVDHSIIMYFLDPEGKFVTFYGKNFSAEQLADGICEHITDWKGKHPEYKGCK